MLEMSFKLIASIHRVNWPVKNILAFTTTRNFPRTSLKKQKVLVEESSRLLCNLTPQNSAPPFNDFNLGLHVGDNESSVKYNRDYLSHLLNLTPTDRQENKVKIQWLDQVHGNSVAFINSYQEAPLVADAIITSTPNLPLAIMTADCLPILLTNKSGTKIAAIHAGWRPLAAGIIEKTINAMAEAPQDLYVWLGPCIGKNAFEVGEEVKEIFVDDNTDFEKMFSAKSSPDNKKYLCDLASIAKSKLCAVGVKEITHLEHCTFDRRSEYFSYRRDNKTGRMASIINITQ